MSNQSNTRSSEKTATDPETVAVTSICVGIDLARKLGGDEMVRKMIAAALGSYVYNVQGIKDEEQASNEFVNMAGACLRNWQGFDVGEIKNQPQRIN